MGKLYFGFALADSMFAEVGNCEIVRRVLSHTAVKDLFAEMTPISSLNPSHIATIHAMNTRYGILVDVPAAPPKVALQRGDSIIVMGVRGLQRLTDRHEYTEAEIDRAVFSFSLYKVK